MLIVCRGYAEMGGGRVAIVGSRVVAVLLKVMMVQVVGGNGITSIGQ